MRFSKKRSGFTTLEMLLVLLIFGVIGYVGYYVYNSRSKANSLYNSAASTPQVATTNALAGWQTVKSPDGSFSFQMPKAWVSLTCENSGGSSSAVYIASSKTNLAKCQSDFTGEGSLMIMDDQSAKNPPAKDPTYQSYTTVPIQVGDDKGNKTTYKTSAGPGIGSDTTYVVYSFLSGKESYYAYFTELNGLPAVDLKNFDLIVKNWEF